jgi:hypothetical protein
MADDQTTSPIDDEDFNDELTNGAPRDVVERRSGDRRQRSAEEAGYTGPDRRVAVDRRTGLERRRGAGIRREEDRRSAEEGEMTVEQFEFVRAIEAFKKSSATPFPTWMNIFDVVQTLGYRVAEEPTLDLGDAQISNPDFVHLTGERANFVKAIEAYKSVNKKRFPTWTEVLEVVEQLGYRKLFARSVVLENVLETPIYDRGTESKSKAA